MVRAEALRLTALEARHEDEIVDGLLRLDHDKSALVALREPLGRTVEVHVTALFDRAGCDSRASLVAMLWAG